MHTYHLAKKVVTILVEAGYITYFAGGWVRDFVLGHPSEDIDIATEASPEKIQSLFPHTIPVGLSFGIVIVVLEGHQFEVATFRKDLDYIDGRHPQLILKATPFEDALRRDFTINGMFYDPLEEKIHDYVEGQRDLRHGVIRAIGDPSERFFEDRLRMLRAFRFAARFSFFIDPETEEAIREHKDKLFPAVAMERVWQEFTKMALYPRLDEAIVEMHRVELLDEIFPEIKGLPLHELRKWVSHYRFFPADTPPILYFMELFPHLSLEEKWDIARRLRVTNDDLRWIERYENFLQAIEKKITDKVIWVHLYASEGVSIILHVIASRYTQEERNLFLSEQEKQQNILFSHIQRVKNKQPLVTGKLLKREGILPGKKMGILMKLAERLAIDQNLNEEVLVMQKLKEHPLWEMR